MVGRRRGGVSGRGVRRLIAVPHRCRTPCLDEDWPDRKKTMTHNQIPQHAIPDWLLESVRVMADVDQLIRTIGRELNDALGLDKLDPRLLRELMYLIDALGAVRMRLRLMDLTTRQILSELARPEPPRHRLVSAG
jgi:hypothetical protein